MAVFLTDYNFAVEMDIYLGGYALEGFRSSEYIYSLKVAVYNPWLFRGSSNVCRFG